MRISFVVALAILIVGGLAGMRNYGRLAVLRETHRVLIERALRKGIAIEPGNPEGELKIAKRQRLEREDRDRKARDLSLELLVFAGDIERLEKSGAHPDQVTQQRGFDLLSKMMDMDLVQMKIIIGALRGDASLSAKTRGDMALFSILVLGQDHPAAALAFFAESSDLLGKGSPGNSAVAMTLSRWAESDPMAALEWVRKNGTAHPAVVTEESKRGIIAGAARTDPALAFRLIGEFNLLDPPDAIHSLVAAAKTAAQRTAVLTALRDHLVTVDDADQREELLQESMEIMGRELSNESVDSVTSWMKAAGLTKSEMTRFASGLSYFNTKEDTGRWIQWMSANLPADSAADIARDLIGQWTQQDYQAAGKWLTASPAGPICNASIATYAETVAEYEPKIAVQWANMLPDGDERQLTYAAIYENWPQADPAGATAFAKEHGLLVEPDKPDTEQDNADDAEVPSAEEDDGAAER